MSKTDMLNWLNSIKARPLNYGPVRTWRVAKSLGISTGLARRLLVQLERDGKISRSERYSRPNALAWEFPYDAARKGEGSGG